MCNHVQLRDATQISIVNISKFAGTCSKGFIGGDPCTFQAIIFLLCGSQEEKKSKHFTL